jgi:hypothetical protein
MSLCIGGVLHKLCKCDLDALEEMGEGFTIWGCMVDRIAKKAQLMLIPIGNLGIGETFPITEGHFTPSRG